MFGSCYKSLVDLNTFYLINLMCYSIYAMCWMSNFMLFKSTSCIKNSLVLSFKINHVCLFGYVDLGNYLNVLSIWLVSVLQSCKIKYMNCWSFNIDWMLGLAGNDLNTLYIFELFRFANRARLNIGISGHSLYIDCTLI